MELLIIRHAQSSNNALADQRTRVVDPVLTEIGLRQAHRVAAHLANGIDHETVTIEGQPTDEPTNGLGITRLHCSAMLRALQTATIIGRELGCAPQVWVDIHEEGGMWLDHGADGGIRGYPGMTRSEISARFPECILPAEVTPQGWWRSGQEDPSHCLARAARVSASLRKDAQKNERIAIVTHGGFAAYLMQALLGVPENTAIFFHHDNTGITRVRFRANGRVSVRYQNRVDHLPPDLVT